MHTILLQADGAGWQQFIPLVLVGVVVYFFMIRPQAKKAKESKKFKEAISKGDRVVTIGGIHGKVKEVNDQTLLIETEGSNRLRVERSAVSMEYSTGSGASELEAKPKAD